MKYMLEINQFILQVSIGVEAEERSSLQDISLDIEINFASLPKSCQSDNIHHAICYANLTEEIEQFCFKKEFYLIEHLSFSIHSHLKATLLDPKDRLKIKVCKNPPLEKVKGNCCFIVED